METQSQQTTPAQQLDEQATQNLEPLSPCLDIVFKSIFTRNCEDSRIARNALISSLTGLEIEDTDVLNNDIPISMEITQKNIRLDVHCKSKNGEEFDVEIQMEESNYNIPNRLEYYASRLLSGAKNVSHDYHSLKSVYQIMICSKFNVSPEERDPLLINTMRNQYGHHFGSLLHIITLELPKIDLPKKEISKISDEELEAWFESLTNAEKWGTFFKWAGGENNLPQLSRFFDVTLGAGNARRILMEMSQSRAERELAEARLKWLMDYTSDKNGAYRKGVHDNAIDTARKMLSKGLSPDMISDCTSLPLSEVTALQAELTQTA